jgi:hypothetical protein
VSQEKKIIIRHDGSKFSVVASAEGGGEKPLIVSSTLAEAITFAGGYQRGAIENAPADADIIWQVALELCPAPFAGAGSAKMYIQGLCAGFNS